MTLSTAINSNRYSGDGSTTTFAYTFKIFADSQIKVILKNKTTGVESVQALGSDYTLTGVTESGGGNIVFTTAPANTVNVVARRNIAYTQETQYIANDAFPASAHEDALDRIVMLAQQINTEDTLTVRLPEGDIGAGLTTTLPSVADRKNRYVMFDDSGNIDVSVNTITNSMRFYRQITEPSGSDINEGDMWYKTDTEDMYFYRETGSNVFEWTPLATATNDSDVLDGGSY